MKWFIPWVKALFASFGEIVPPPAEYIPPPPDYNCKATTVGGVAGNAYRRYCRRTVPHEGKMHRDGDYVWSD